MIKTKKNGFLKAAGLMMGATMLMTCVLGGTMAKYVTDGTATGAKVTAAKWEIDVNSEKIEDSTSVDIGSLTWEIAESTDGATAGSYADDKIVPGTWGYAEIKIKNAGEVDANVTVEGDVPTATPSNAGLKFAIMETAPADESAVENSTTLGTTGITLEKKDANDGSGNDEKSIYVAYSWDFDDANDNNDVQNESDEFTFGDITITAEQVGGAA